MSVNSKTIKTFSDFKKSIIVTDWYCSKTGIEIHYDLAGKELSLLADVEQACALLETIGTIEAHAFENDTHFLLVEIEGPNEQTKAVWIEWENFLLSYDFSQSEAIDVAAMHEGEKQLQDIIKGRRAA